jgi:hypothetical protein
MMRDSWTFKISVGQLSESLLNQLSDAIFKYTVPLIVDDLVIGTGTLAQIDKTAGIFTARHVTTKIFEGNKRLGRCEEFPLELLITGLLVRFQHGA